MFQGIGAIVPPKNDVRIITIFRKYQDDIVRRLEKNYPPIFSAAAPK
jgi:hypothetical protein